MIPLIYQDIKSQDIYYPIGTKEIVKTEQIWIDSNGLLSELCHVSKNLWNESNYIVRQLYCLFSAKADHKLTGSYMKYSDLDYLIKNKSENYKKLSGATSQQILKILDRSWKSFFNSIKDWKLNPSKYLGRPRLPGYKKKDGEFLLVFTNQQCKIKDGFLIFPRKLKLNDKNNRIRTRLDDETNLREVRIIPKGGKYIIEIVYQIEEHQLDLNKNRVIGIDFGLRNIVTIVNNIGEKPICIKGGVLKSINQYYNKKLAELKTIYSKQKIKIEETDKNTGIKTETFKQRLTGPAIQRLTNNRNRNIKDAMHKYSRWIIDYCIRHNIGTIVNGVSPGWKQEINLGGRTNQSFVSIPTDKLRKLIKYKAKEIGIDVKEQEESYTSKCSFLDDEPIGHSERYMGKRIYNTTCHGGLFRSSIGKIINADVQGAYNIIKKAIPKAFMNLMVIREADGIEGVGTCSASPTSPVGLHPIRINPLGVNRNINIMEN